MKKNLKNSFQIFSIALLGFVGQVKADTIGSVGLPPPVISNPKERVYNPFAPVFESWQAVDDCKEGANCASMKEGKISLDSKFGVQMDADSKGSKGTVYFQNGVKSFDQPKEGRYMSFTGSDKNSSGGMTRFGGEADPWNVSAAGAKGFTAQNPKNPNVSVNLATGGLKDGEKAMNLEEVSKHMGGYASLNVPVKNSSGEKEGEVKLFTGDDKKVEGEFIYEPSKTSVAKHSAGK